MGREETVFVFRAFQAFCTFSFLFLEMWAWPPAQRNDLGFKCEIPHSLRAFRNRRPSVPQFRADTWRIHQITCQKRAGETSTFANCNKHARPFPPSCQGQQWSLPRWDPERRQEKEVLMWGKFTLAFYCFLLYLLGWPVCGPSITQRVYVCLCMLVCQTQKGILPSKYFCLPIS